MNHSNPPGAGVPRIDPAPQSLQPDEVYALTAWLLHRNGVLPADAQLDATSLPKVQLANRAGFVGDARPDTANSACRQCR